MKRSSRAAAILLGAAAGLDPFASRRSMARGFLALSLLFLPAACAKEGAQALRRIDAFVSELAKRADMPTASGGLAAYRIILETDPYYAEGSELIARALDGKIVRVDLTAFGDLGKLEDSYVFRAGELIWSRKKEYRWSASSAGMRLESLKTWHFQEGRTLRMEDGLSGKVLGPSAPLQDLASAILEEADRLSRIARAAISSEAP